MQVERYSFIKCTDINELENIMRMAKQKFPTIEILFVIINRKGDPAYGNIIKLVRTFCLDLVANTGSSRTAQKSSNGLVIWTCSLLRSASNRGT